jgi:hypothetical protein
MWRRIFFLHSEIWRESGKGRGAELRSPRAKSSRGIPRARAASLAPSSSPSPPPDSLPFALLRPNKNHQDELLRLICTSVKSKVAAACTGTNLSIHQSRQRYGMIWQASSTNRVCINLISWILEQFDGAALLHGRENWQRRQQQRRPNERRKNSREIKEKVTQLYGPGLGTKWLVACIGRFESPVYVARYFNIRHMFVLAYDGEALIGKEIHK